MNLVKIAQFKIAPHVKVIIQASVSNVKIIIMSIHQLDNVKLAKCKIVQHVLLKIKINV